MSYPGVVAGVVSKTHFLDHDVANFSTCFIGHSIWILLPSLSNFSSIYNNTMQKFQIIISLYFFSKRKKVNMYILKWYNWRILKKNTVGLWKNRGVSECIGFQFILVSLSIIPVLQFLHYSRKIELQNSQPDSATLEFLKKSL